jgi:O-antigen ligase
MAKLTRFLFYLIYLTLGSYAAPQLRLGWGEHAFPYAVPLSVVLAAIVLLHTMKNGGRVKLSSSLCFLTQGYLLSVVGSTLMAREPHIVLAFKYSLMALLPILAALIASRERTLNVALVCLLFSGLGLFAYGAHGYLTWRTGDPAEHALGYFGVTYMMSTRNTDMLYLQVTFWLLLGYRLLGMRRAPFLTRFGVTVVLLALVLAVIMSLVRGAWVSMSLAFVFMWFLMTRLEPRINRSIVLWRLASIALTFLGLHYFLPQDKMQLLVDRFGSIFLLSGELHLSNTARIALAGEVLSLIVAHPIFGVGVGNLRHHLMDFPYGPVNHAENVYLQVFAEQGVIGFVSYVGLILWVSMRLLRGLRRARAMSHAVACWALLAIVVNWVIYGLFNNVVDNLWFWAVFGLAAALANTVRVRTPVKYYQTRPDGGRPVADNALQPQECLLAPGEIQ